MPSWLIQLIFISSLIGGAYFYFTWTQNKIEKLNATVQVLTMQNEVNQVTIKNLKAASKFNEKSLTDMSKRASQAEKYKEEVIRLFQEHDLTKLSIAKPGLIERRINEGTKNAFDDLESITSD